MTIDPILKTAIDALVPHVEAAMRLPFIRHTETHLLARRINDHIEEIRIGAYETTGLLIAEIGDIVEAMRSAGLEETNELFLLEVAIDEVRSAMRHGMKG